MRLCLVLAVALFPGCLTVRSALIDGQDVETSYLGPIPVRRTSLPARPIVKHDDNGKAIGVLTPEGLVPLGVEFEFCGKKWIAEEISLIDGTKLPYGNGEVIPVELGEGESAKIIRVGVKLEGGGLQDVGYDFTR